MIKESDCIFGLRPVIEAIRSGRQVERLLVRQGLRGDLYRELMSEVRKFNIDYQVVPAGRIELVTRKNHQGVLAWISVIEYQQVGNILPSIFEKGEDPLLLLLDGISDVRNFGAIVRSAECMGAHAVIIPVRGSARISADAIKASSGALNTFPVCRDKSVTRIVRYLRDSGLKIVCATDRKGEPAPSASLTGPLLLILGSEDKGISRELASLADLTVSIPMSGNIGSLNVSVAAGIMLYEIARQRSR
jgi:23S rRNA (guanosine2251-2'-O)-methyltransferase